MKQKIIAWFKRESDKKYVFVVLGLVAFFESIIFPVPVDIFTLALSAAQPRKWFRFATVATVSSVVGGIVAYYIGSYFFDTIGVQIINLFGLDTIYQQVVELFNRGVFIVMFMSAFTPIPYKIFTLAGGALGVPLLPFIFASILGRGLRFYLEAFIPYKYGERIAKRFYKIFNNITLLLVCVGVIIFVLYKYLL